MAKNKSAAYNGYSVKDVSDRAGDVSQTAVSTLQAGLAKSQDLLSSGFDVAQEQLRQGKKQTQKGLDKTQKNIGRVQDTVQDKAQSTLLMLQGLIQAALSIAQVVIAQNLKRANKSLTKAQKNLSHLQGSVQDSVQSGLKVAPNVLGKGTKTFGKSLAKVTENVKDMQGSFQKQLERHQRKQARKKALFRMGLVSGIVLALLYAPWPGSETRRQLGEFFHQVTQQAQNMRERYKSGV